MICVYDPLASSFEGNGAAVLTPTSAKTLQVAGGEYTFSMTHPMDPWEKWEKLVEEAVVRLPVPKEEIDNAFSGYAADIYKVTVDGAALREGPSEPEAITYATWDATAVYQVGNKCSYGGRNYRCVYFDATSGQTQVPPPNSSWWTEIPHTTSGAAELIKLKLGTELYLVEDVDSTWYKMSTYYGVVGYIKKTQVTFDRHVDPSEITGHTITEQLFRIKEVNIDRKNRRVDVRGVHVSNDMKGTIVKDVTLNQASPAMAVGKIMEGLVTEYRGTVATNLTASGLGTITKNYKGKNGIYCLLDQDSGIVPTFGAKLTRDNWDIFVMEKTETDRGYQIRYAKNANGINWKKKTDGLITRVMPVAKDESGGDLYLPEVYVDSADINNYPVVYMEPLKVSGQVGKAKSDSDETVWTEADLLAEMRTKAGERFSVDLVDQVNHEITVQLEQLEKTAEFKWMKDLLRVLLYDKVLVADPEIGLSVSLFVSELEYDCIAEKISGLKLTNTLYKVNRSVTGYNVVNGSIGAEKLKEGVAQEIIQEAVDKSQDFANPYVVQTHVNTKDQDGYVLKGDGQNKKVWGTDDQGNPGWRESGNIEIVDNLTSHATDKALSANQGRVLNAKFDDYVKIEDIIDNLTSSATNKPLSAKQGKTLKTALDTLASLVKCANWLPSNGYNPLTSDSGFFCYGINPNLVMAQGYPPNFNGYGFVFGCAGSAYQVLFYGTVFGDLALYATNTNTWRIF